MIQELFSKHYSTNLMSLNLKQLHYYVQKWTSKKCIYLISKNTRWYFGCHPILFFLHLQTFLESLLSFYNLFTAFYWHWALSFSLRKARFLCVKATILNAKISVKKPNISNVYEVNLILWNGQLFPISILKERDNRKSQLFSTVKCPMDMLLLAWTSENIKHHLVVLKISH